MHHYFRDPTQEKAYHLMVQDHQGKPFFGQFGTGSGKTYLGAHFAQQHEEATVIALPTHNLITQTQEKILNDYPWLGFDAQSVKRFYPMSAYPSPSKCEKLQVSYHDGEYVDEIIARLKETRPLLTASEIALDGDCPKSEKAAYYAAKDDLAGAKVLLTTHHAILNDAWTGGRYLNFAYRYLIVDEADQIHSMAKLRFNRSITKSDLIMVKADINLDLSTPADLQILIAHCEKALLKHDDKQRVLELIATVSAIKHYVGKEPTYYNYGKEQSGDWKIFFKNPAKIIKRLYEEKQVFFLSATLSMSKDLNRFGRLVGAKVHSPHSAVIEAEDFGRLNFILTPRITYDERISFLENHRDDPKHPSYLDKALVTAYVAKIRSQGNVLILTASADDTESLGEAFPEAVIQERGENLKFAIERLRQRDTDQPVMLIAHGAWAGLDLGIAFQHVVIPRLPYPYPSDVENEPFHDMVEWVTRKVAQGIGRAIRAQEHTACIAILDRRFPWSGRTCQHFGKTNVFSAAHSFLANAIPSRFRETTKDMAPYGYNRASIAHLNEQGELKIQWFQGQTVC